MPVSFPMQSFLSNSIYFLWSINHAGLYHQLLLLSAFCMAAHVCAIELINTAPSSTLLRYKWQIKIVYLRSTTCWFDIHIHCEMITTVKLMNTSPHSYLLSWSAFNVKMFATVLSVPLSLCSAFTSKLSFLWETTQDGLSFGGGIMMHSFLGGEGKWRCLVHGVAAAWVNGFLSPGLSHSSLLDWMVLTAPIISDSLLSRHQACWREGQRTSQMFWNTWTHW